MTVVRSTVRFRDGGFELRCEYCAARTNVAAYWPLTTEFWYPSKMARCKACYQEDDRLRHRARGKAARAAYQREWRSRNPGYNAAATALSRRMNPEAKRESDRRYEAANRERRNAANRERRAA